MLSATAKHKYTRETTMSCQLGLGEVNFRKDTGHEPPSTDVPVKIEDSLASFTISFDPESKSDFLGMERSETIPLRWVSRGLEWSILSVYEF